MKKVFTAGFLKDVVIFIIGIAEAFLLLRIALKFTAANPDAPFVKWVYDTTYPLIYPFIGMFPSKITGIQVEIEFSTMFAMIIYVVLSYAVLSFISILEKPSR